ncbi:hypothetical protein BT69DRAFT_1226588 [Atractiella rhizophila]|nr:hypothetical protein BT69DRAFT_1226588 [Atractiella rhizophila]
MPDDSPYPVPDVSGPETTHYNPFIKYMQPFIKETWKLVNTNDKTDRDFFPVLGVVGVKPDLVLYSDRLGTGTVMKKAESFGEFKKARKDEPFRDEKIEKDVRVIEGSSQTAKGARGQLTIYSSVILSSQQRTRVFSFYVSQHSARLLCHSRAGFLVTPLFDYVATPHLRKVFWRFTHANDAERGHDTTMQDPLEGDDDAEEAKTKLNVIVGKPIFKVMVQNKAFYISDPFIFRHNQPVGRGTRCFEAYDPEQKRLVLLKDTWRHSEYRSEGEVYPELHAHKVPNILQVVAEGDVTGKFQRVKLSADDKDKREMVHYRLVLNKVGRSLNKFRSSYELVKGFSDAFEASWVGYSSLAAWDNLGMLHRDVSFGNIILGPVEEEPKGYLIDWEFAKKKSDPVASLERTGTYEFMSHRLLRAIHSKQTIRHDTEDDIESFVYVLIWTVISYAQSELSDEDRRSLLLPFDRMQNSIESTVTGRNGIITSGAGALKVNTLELDQVLQDLFLDLSYRLVTPGDLVAQTRNLQRLIRLPAIPAAEEKQLIDSMIGQMATHTFMRELLRRALMDETRTWRGREDGAVSRETQGSKRRGVTIERDSSKRLKSSNT